MNGQPAAEPLRIGAFAPLFIDVFAPLAVYTVLSRLGASDLVSLGAAALLPALYVVVAAIRGQRIDRMAALVLVLLALAIVLTLATGDPRILLAKSVIVTGFAGLYFLATLLAERPFIFYAAQKLVARREANGEAAWDARWQASPAFRQAMRLLTVIWGAGLIGEAAVRAWIIYTLPVSHSVIWGQLWAIGCLIGLIVLSLRIGRRTRETVRAELQS
jgi:hypothetical protein